MDDLRYPTGRFEQPVSLTPRQRAAAIDRIAGTPAALRRAVEGLSKEQVDTPYRPDGWTVRQVVHHLPDSHLNSFVRFKLGLTEEHPTIGTYREARWAELPDSRADVDVSLDLLETLHRRWVLLLRSMDDADWQRTIDHPEMGPMRLDALLALYAWHGPHHVAHITSLRERKGW